MKARAKDVLIATNASDSWFVSGLFRLGSVFRQTVLQGAGTNPENLSRTRTVVSRVFERQLDIRLLDFS